MDNNQIFETLWTFLGLHFVTWMYVNLLLRNETTSIILFPIVGYLALLLVIWWLFTMPPPSHPDKLPPVPQEEE